MRGRILNVLTGGVSAVLGGSGVGVLITYLFARPNQTLCIEYDVAAYILMLVAVLVEAARHAQPEPLNPYR